MKDLPEILNEPMPWGCVVVVGLSLILLGAIGIGFFVKLIGWLYS